MSEGRIGGQQNGEAEDVESDAGPRGARYDRLASGYDRWWGPVIAPSALTVLDEAEALVRAGACRILDLGTGTGTLAIEAVRRWSGARVTGVDASDGMLAIARQAATDLGDAADRVDFRAALADRLPDADGSFDLVVSSFVLQLVPNRYRALREARRVLRAGGSLVFVTWLAARNEASFEPDVVFDDMMDTFGLADPDDADEDGPDGSGGSGASREDDQTGDLPSVEAAIRLVRRAGFRKVTATRAALTHAYAPDEYVGFLEHFDEEDLFASLDDEVRQRFRSALAERLRALPERDMILTLPTVLVRAERP